MNAEGRPPDLEHGFERVYSLRNAWFNSSVGGALAVAILAAVSGFVWFPSVQSEIGPDGLWDAICAAAGVPHVTVSSTQATSTSMTSTAVVTQQILMEPSAESIGRGSALAMQCTVCHGGTDAQGLPDAPVLAGQYAISLYKELLDFKSGARTNELMSPQVEPLSDQDMRDLAAYFASLRHMAASGTSRAPRIVVSGAPMRNIPPCAACHGGLDAKAGAPLLQGQPVVYLRAQLQAFSDNTRHNDISEQMRNIARHMTPQEMDAASSYLSGNLK